MKSSLAAAIAALLCSGLALADARITYQTTEGGGADIESVLIGHGKVRTDAGGSGSVIMDPGAGTMIVIDHAERQYTRIGRDDVEQLVAGLDGAMRQMEQALANVPPEMRAQMEGMIGGMMPGGEAMVKVVDTGRGDTVAGHACTIYRTEVQGQVFNESCMGSVSAFADLSAADRRTLDDAMALTRSMMEPLSQGPLASLVDGNLFHDGRVPLRMTDLDGGQRRTSEFAGIDQASLSADQFAVPAGYREQQIEMPNLGF